MTTNEDYNKQLIDYCAVLLKKNREELFEFLDKSYVVEKFKRGTDLIFKTDLKSIMFSKNSFTLTFNTPIRALSKVFLDIKKAIYDPDYERPKYIYFSLDINEKNWIWFENYYPSWNFEQNTLTFNYRIEDYWDKSGNLLMGELTNYRDFPFIPEIRLDRHGESTETFKDKIVINSPNRLMFENYVTLDLREVKYNNYTVTLSLDY